MNIVNYCGTEQETELLGLLCLLYIGMQKTKLLVMKVK